MYVYIYGNHVIVPFILYPVKSVHFRPVSRYVEKRRQVCPRQKLCAFYHHRHEKRPTPQDGDVGPWGYRVVVIYL